MAAKKKKARAKKSPNKSSKKRVSKASKKKAPVATMKAAAIDRTGPPEVLTIHTLPIPKVGPKDVLISLLAAGVGIWDAQIRKGEYSIGTQRFPRVLGSDGAGVVVEVGKDVDRFKEGDRVWAYEWGGSKTGFYAEYVSPNEKNVAHAPDGLTLIEAGAAAVTGLTALQGVDDHLKLDKSDTILVFGATGAVGSLAVQFAKGTGAHVVATASPGRAQTTLREIGIDQVFDPRAADAPERLRSFAPGGLNAILAFAGGDDLEQCIDQLVADGRVAYPNGIEPEPRKRPKIRKIPYDAVGGRAPLERLIYRVCSIGPTREMRWTHYALAMLTFNLLGGLAVYGLQRLQLYLPLNPHEEMTCRLLRREAETLLAGRKRGSQPTDR
jgi:NADPH:quinone reductase-like Zn-dependent oxidoreductase